MLLYLLFWTILGFIFNFYIIFGTNLLTGGPAQIVVFCAYFSVSQKRNIKRSPNGMKPSGELFFEQMQSRRLGVDDKKQTRWPRGSRARPRGWARPPPSWAPRGSPDRLLSPIYIYVPQKHLVAPRKLFPPPQPSVPMRSHLGAFFGVLPEGALIMEGFYINTIASPMMCE